MAPAPVTLTRSRFPQPGSLDGPTGPYHRWISALLCAARCADAPSTFVKALQVVIRGVIVVVRGLDAPPSSLRFFGTGRRGFAPRIETALSAAILAFNAMGPGGVRWQSGSLWGLAVSLEERIFEARRLGCLHALMGGGQSPDLAERWCEAWEREAAVEGRARSGEFWEDGLRWINAQIAMRRSPDALAVRR